MRMSTNALEQHYQLKSIHGLTYSYLKDCTNLLKNITTVPESLLLLCGCVLLTAVYSIPQLTAFTNKVAALQFPAAAAQIGISFVHATSDSVTGFYLRTCHLLHERMTAFTWLLYRRKAHGFGPMMFLGGRF